MTSENDTVHNLADDFRMPRAEQFGPVPIWWWSGDTLTRERLRWQMEQLRSQGVAQAVIMNLAPTGPLYGSLADDPPFMSDAWWDVFLGACEDAAELNFRFWPYDQIGFSGANFQGRLVTATPRWAGRSLGRATAEIGGEPVSITVPRNAEPLLAYVVSEDGERAQRVPLVDRGATWSESGSTLVVIYHQEHGFDYFNTDAVTRLIDTIHGEFERRAGHWFGSVITGFFQDELPSMPTWSTGFAAGFLRSEGYDLVPLLGALWHDPVPPSDAGPGIEASPTTDAVRLAYQRHRAASARAGFFDPLTAWFAERGLQYGFDQQSPAREGDPAGSVEVYADYQATHAAFSAPGSDHLGDPKIHSSMSHLNGGTRTWIEAFHSSGWGGTLEETYDWLAPFLKRGATLYDPHAVYYSTRGGWWEWAPPSTCWRQPYWPEYHLLAEAVTRLSTVLSAGELSVETALLFPTVAMQAGSSFLGPLPAAVEATRVYHALNGATAWAAERPGILDRAGFEYEIVDDAMLAGAHVEDGFLHVRTARFRNVIVPSADVLPTSAAGALAELADAGGTVVIVGAAPTWFAGDGDGGERFRTASATGSIRIIADADDVSAVLERGRQWVEADVPTLVRSIGGTQVIALFAHDGLTGTKQPILSGSAGYLDWIHESWSSFWEGLRDGGYEFRPAGDRVARVTLHGVEDAGVQRWNPRDGSRETMAAGRSTDGGTVLDVDFRDGSVALLVVGQHLPPALSASSARATPVSETTVSDWRVQARSTLDNRFGDFGARERTGILPIEVWTFHTAEGAEPEEVGWEPATATFGPYAEVTGPHWPSERAGGFARWKRAEWSLSRGIRNDPVHQETLGPKGYIPEEFLHWPSIEPGQVVAARTWIDVPGDDLFLVVGSNAVSSILIDGDPADGGEGSGYWRTWPVTVGRHQIELRLTALHAEAIRASFAVVMDAESYRRPEWLQPVEDGLPASLVATETTFELGSLPSDGRIQVGAEQPCTIVINGIEIGRQNAFHPYGAHREARFVPYDLSPHLRTGENRLQLISVDSARPVAVVVDAVPGRDGGLGIATREKGWTATRDGEPVALAARSRQWLDPRLAALVARPHPLPRASWLEKPFDPEGAVADVVPDIDPTDRRPRWLRCDLPVGAVVVELVTALVARAWIGGVPADIVEGRIVIEPPAAAGAALVLRFDEPGGQRSGALIDEPLRVTTVEAAAPLLDWADLGLGALAGEVAYRADLPAVVFAAPQRVVLDLGDVRGSAQVLVNDTPAAAMAWGPYRLDVTDLLNDGANRVEVRVHNTLAGYLDVASPTPGIFAGQRRAGLFGPVRLIVEAGG